MPKKRKGKKKQSPTKKPSKRSPTRLAFSPGLESIVNESDPLVSRVAKLQDEVRFTVAPSTVSGERIQAQRGRLHTRSLDDFRPRSASVDDAVARLTALGFRILRVGRFGISAAGPARLVMETLKLELAVQSRPIPVSLRATHDFARSFAAPGPADLFIAPTESLTIAQPSEPAIDDIVFIPPPIFFAPPSPTAPTHTFHSVDAARIRKLLNVPSASGGSGVKVAIVDAGFFRHPYYSANGFDYKPTPTQLAPNPENDADGHGTAIAYNLFATAPKVSLLGFQHSDPPQDAIEQAAEAGVDVISCSWGWDNEQTFPILEASIRSVVAEGKTTLFAAGNGQLAWPGSMPEVISIGGVYWNPAQTLEASNFASGFASNQYPGRKVPDVSGLCGERPQAIYIMMPCKPSCRMEMELAGSDFPNHDQTKADDGWVGASGTSSATPQVAGVVALLIEKARAKGRTLLPADVKRILQETGKAIEKGHNAQGAPAIGRPNLAVGYGLVDAQAALAML